MRIFTIGIRRRRNLVCLISQMFRWVGIRARAAIDQTTTSRPEEWSAHSEYQLLERMDRGQLPRTRHRQRDEVFGGGAGCLRRKSICVEVHQVSGPHTAPRRELETLLTKTGHA